MAGQAPEEDFACFILWQSHVPIRDVIKYIVTHSREHPTFSLANKLT